MFFLRRGPRAQRAEKMRPSRTRLKIKNMQSHLEIRVPNLVILRFEEDTAISINRVLDSLYCEGALHEYRKAGTCVAEQNQILGALPSGVVAPSG